jgi:predicted secreted hydrolase
MKTGATNLLLLRHAGVFVVGVIGVFVAVGLIWGLGSGPVERDVIDIAGALSSQGGGDCYRTAIDPADIRFPRDHGPHNDFKTEWWYYTGNLKTEQGRHFGYQLTFFRRALSCGPITGTSKWRTRQLYFAHFAVTDTRLNHFHSGFRMNRESIGIAGSMAKPFRVWIDNWSASGSEDKIVLTAEDNKTTLNVSLTPEKPIVLQGDRGLSRKGPKASNASYYYSWPRLATKGTLKIGSQTYGVSGNSWFDHEWGTTALGRDVAGWDWFAVHLDDGRDLMVCQIRDSQGNSNGYGFGSLSFPDGRAVILGDNQFTITPKKYWKSPTTGKRYPAEWRITLPGHGLLLTVQAVISKQEHTQMFVYWEGAVRVFGKGTDGSPGGYVNGTGYAELTGY